MFSTKTMQSGNSVVAALAFGLIFTPTASAQSGPTAEETTDSQTSKSAADILTQDTIIVTGTKKAGGQDVQDTAVSMVAFGASQLDALNVKDISNLSYKIPNVTLDDLGTTKGVANFSMRGLGTNSSIPSIDPAVGTFVDGVYLGINYGVIFDTFDLSSVEALRGPQGVLFGRNVTGGAVLLNTNDPTEEFSIKTKMSADSGLRGTGVNYTGQAIMSGPIVKDILLGKIGIYHNDDGGWFKNSAPTSSGNFGKSDTTMLRGALKYLPNIHTTFTLKYEHGEQNGDGPAGQSHINGSGLEGQIVNFSRDEFDFSIDEEGFSKAKWDFVSAKSDFDVDFGNGTITNVFGWRQFEQTARSDIDSTPASLFHGDFATVQDQISNELRYNGTLADGRLDFTTGIYYFEQNLTYGEGRDLLGGALTQDGGGILKQKTSGIFASGDFLATDKLTITTGIRYSDEQKDVDITRLSANVNNPCFVSSEIGRSTTACVPDFVSSFSTNNISPKLGVKYEINEEFRLYAHWARAFRAGGFNFRNTSNAPAATPGPFGDERVDNLEIGFKSEPMTGARINGAIFYNDLKDLQRETNVANAGSGVVQVIKNTADAEIFGIEFDATISLTDNLVLTAGLGYIDGEYTLILSDISGDGVVDAADLALDIPRLAPLSTNLGITYSHDIPGVGPATLNASYSHRDAAAYTDTNFGVFNTIDRLDANYSVSIMDGAASLSLYGKNLTNEVQFGGDTQLPATLGPVPLGGTFAPLTKGRQIGIELEYGF